MPGATGGMLPVSTRVSSNRHCDGAPAPWLNDTQSYTAENGGARTETQAVWLQEPVLTSVSENNSVPGPEVTVTTQHVTHHRALCSWPPSQCDRPAMGATHSHVREGGQKDGRGSGCRQAPRPYSLHQTKLLPW